MATVVATGGAGPARPQAQWARKYPPLIALAVALLIAIVVLPSALNLPQSNPATTLEYAPVPPSNDKTPPPPNGNLSSLGLAGSSSLQTGGAPGGDQGGLPIDNTALNPPPTGHSHFHCVGNPPRQTDDPLAPPCVADFRGDNFGATYQGVTASSITVLIYYQGFTQAVNLCQDANQVSPDHQYFDLDQPAQPGEYCVTRVMRNWSTYFNDRYQTYNRHVHFWLYYSGSGESAEERRADAADNYSRVKPFAVISTGSTFSDDYLDTMASRGVLNFGSFLGHDQAFFNRYPKLIWGYPPSVDEGARVFVSYLCTRLAGKPVQSNFTNMPQDVGKPRVYGLWHSGDKSHPELDLVYKQVKAGMQKCGMKVQADHTFPEVGFVKSAHYAPTAAQQAAADFRTQNVTTIIWPGGLETNFSQAADNIGYRPEILVMGDELIEAAVSGGFQAQNVWDHSRVVTHMPAVFNERTQPCYTYYKEVQPDADDNEVRADACPIYADLRQLFTGIQVAGPRLGPTSIDKGFHAIPRIASTNPQVPACYYLPNDYTCIKDAVVEHWDQTGRTTTASETPGCYRLTEGGKRYDAGNFPSGNATDQDQATDPCNVYDTVYVINPAPPDANNPG